MRGPDFPMQLLSMNDNSWVKSPGGAGTISSLSILKKTIVGGFFCTSNNESSNGG
jgi:hypothetical protein